MYALILKHKKIAVVIIAVASLSFLFWMFSVADIQQMFGLKRCAAEVNGSCITLREFRYELLKYSDLLDRDELRGAIKRQVLFTLIGREVLYQKALELGVVASDSEVAQVIKSDPSFQKNGSFDMKTYREALERVGLTPPEYETYLKKQLTARRLVDLVSRLVYVTDREREFQERILSTRFEGRVYFVSYEALSKEYKPSEEEIKEFYEENKDKFLTPERKVYIFWETKDKKEAHNIYSSLKKGKVPEGGRELKEVSGLPGDVSKELERLSEDNRFTITKVKGTYYVIYLKEIEPKRVKPLSEVREEVERMLREEKGWELAEKRAWELKEKLEKGKEVSASSMEFENSSLEEFIKLFRIRGEETLRLVFSKDKVFGPYRMTNGYALVYIEKRRVEPVKAEGGLVESLKRAKEEAIVNMFVDRLIKDAKVKINEEYLR